MFVLDHSNKATFVRKNKIKKNKQERGLYIEREEI